MERNITFNPVSQYEEREINPLNEEEETMEKIRNDRFKKQYKYQFQENRNDAMNQRKANKQFIPLDEWEKLDSNTGPKAIYTGKAELEEGPILQGKLNALINRGYNVKKKINQRTGENTNNLGVWGGKIRKTKKSRKTRKTRKSRKTNRRRRI